ncbi:MAG: acetyl-CoA carboxylase, biotin carboxyl carrier protein [Elusimicrobia bacterium]|nr:acetyl-CoA carboxylase, biotin carboxyl carrier protein [Elusimicrobiota bacterium]
MAKKMQTKQIKKEALTPLEEIKKFYEFMVANKLDLLEYSQDGKTLRLARKSTVPSVHPIPVFSGPVSNPPASHSQNQPSVQETGETIKSPMSGIFYRAPSPSSPPYVREGDQVKAGQVLCIVEAMKVFNEIKADFDCVIKKVICENGKPIAANQDIFLVERK